MLTRRLHPPLSYELWPATEGTKSRWKVTHAGWFLSRARDTRPHPDYRSHIHRPDRAEVPQTRSLDTIRGAWRDRSPEPAGAAAPTVLDPARARVVAPEHLQARARCKPLQIPCVSGVSAIPSPRVLTLCLGASATGENPGRPPDQLPPMQYRTEHRPSCHGAAPAIPT